MSRRSVATPSAVAIVAAVALGLAACSSGDSGPASTPAASTLGSTAPSPTTAPSTMPGATTAPPTTAAAPSVPEPSPESSPAPSTTRSPTPEPPPAPALLTGAQQPSGDAVDVATGLDAPWSVVFVGDTALISERDSGRIRQLTAGGLRDVGTVAGVEARGEGGLLGLATYPAAAPTHLYAYFTGADDNRIVRMSLTGDAAAGFGLGDPDALNGKILRLTPDGGVPTDNPIAGNPMYSMGHRNPQGLAWDATGQLWAAEFGQDTWDELNRIQPGANYGWPVVEGIAGAADFVDPVQQWATDDASPSGITIAGDTIFIANLRGERLRAVNVTDPSSSTEYYPDGYGRLRDVVVAPDGTLWILTNNTDGRGDPQDGDDRILGVRLTPA